MRDASQPRAILRRDLIHVWQLLVVLMEVFASIDVHKGVGETLQDVIFLKVQIRDI